MTTTTRPAPTPAPVPRPAGAIAPRPASPPAAPAPARPAAPRSRLGAVKRERLRTPLRYLWYGPEGVGKTSLIADMPNPILVDIDGGSSEVEIARYPFRDEPGGHIPRSYEEIVSAIEDLTANPNHGHKTLGIDTADALEAMIHRFICQRDKKSNVESYGFGKGYKVALTEFRRFLSMLEVLRNGGMQIAFAGHSFVKTFKNPEGEDYDRYQLHANDLFSAELRGWCDVVGFIHFEGGGSKLVGDESQSARARGWATGRRLVELARTAAWDAKSRLSLPAELELAAANPWRPFAEAKLIARDATLESLAADILAEVSRITGTEGDAEFTTAAGSKTSRAAITALLSANDAAVLARVLAGLKATTTATAPQET
jgi:hypothetical protein